MIKATQNDMKPFANTQFASIIKVVSASVILIKNYFTGKEIG